MNQSETMFFKTDEMIPCPCGCGLTITSSELWTKLDHARLLADTPFIITSGARCLNYNRKIGSKDTSSHIDGLAVDIATPTSDVRYKILFSLLQAGFKRIGYNGRKKFLHVDVDENKPQNIIFDY